MPGCYGSKKNIWPTFDCTKGAYLKCDYETGNDRNSVRNFEMF